MLRYMIVGIFISSVCCFGMQEGQGISFIEEIKKYPTGDLHQLVDSLSGKDKELADKFCQLYVDPSKDREKVFSGLSEDDLKELYVAADFVARSYYAEMRNYPFDIDKAQKTVKWLTLVDSDIHSGNIKVNSYRDGGKISDLLELAQKEVERQRKFNEENQKCEEELIKFLEGFEEEEEEK